MKMPSPRLLWVLAIIIGAATADALAGGNGPLDGLLVSILLGTALTTRAMPERGFYLLAAGQLLVVAVFRSNPLLAAVIQVVLFAMVLLSNGSFTRREETGTFALFALIIAAVTVLAGTLYHALMPLCIFTILAVTVVLLLVVSEYQLRTFYGGHE